MSLSGPLFVFYTTMNKGVITLVVPRRVAYIIQVQV